MSQGRKSTYTDQIADKICDRLAHGETLNKICEDKDMPSQDTVYEWNKKNPSFSDKYIRARQSQMFFYFEQIIDIADDGTNDWAFDENGNRVLDAEHVKRSRLRIDTRKYYLSKLVPKFPALAGSLSQKANEIISSTTQNFLPLDIAMSLMKLVESEANITAIQKYEVFEKELEKLKQLKKEKQDG